MANKWLLRRNSPKLPAGLRQTEMLLCRWNDHRRGRHNWGHCWRRHRRGDWRWSWSNRGNDRCDVRKWKAEAVIAPETVLTFRLQAPVTISTANSQFAFQPVSQSDLNSRSPGSRPRMARPGPPPPPTYYYPYPYAYGYPYAVYPAPFFGFGYYGGFGRFGGFRR